MKRIDNNNLRKAIRERDELTAKVSLIMRREREQGSEGITNPTRDENISKLDEWMERLSEVNSTLMYLAAAE